MDIEWFMRYSPVHTTDIPAFPPVDSPVDLAPFARMRWWTGAERHDLQAYELGPEADGSYRPVRHPETGEWHIGLEWPEPQTVSRVVVRYAPGQAVPQDLRVEYWRKHWPTPAPERRPGARRGWIGRDDPWHGDWTAVRGARISEGEVGAVVFDPLDLAEIRDQLQLEEAEDYLAPFRRTLKLRLVSSGPAAPLIHELHAYSQATWQALTADVQFLREGDWSGCAEVTHGYLLGVAAVDLGPDSGDGARAWRCSGRQGRVRLRLLYAQGGPGCADRTIVTVRTRERSFSFLADDLAAGPIYLPDYGVCITPAEAHIDLEQFLARVAAAPRPIYDRVAAEPEHSLARALAEIPPLDVTRQDSYEPNYGLYVILGLEAGRQEFGLRYNGELFMSKPVLKPTGRDLARLTWPGMDIHYRFGAGDPPDFREGRDLTRQSRLAGWLPVFVSEWLDRELAWTQTAFAAPLAGPMTPPEARRGDEDVVALLRFTVRNTTAGPKRAYLWLVIGPQEQLAVQDGLVLALGRVVPDVPVTRQWRVEPYRQPVLRGAVRAGRGQLAAVLYAEGEASRAVPSAVLYQVDLAGGESDTVDLAVPCPSLTAAEEWATATGLDFDACLADVVSYWRGIVEPGGQLDLPEPIFSSVPGGCATCQTSDPQILSDFYKATQTHIAISADKDPVSGLLVLPPATWSYGACGNEACWQITMLDQAGQHERAAVYLETFLRTQGAVRPNGRFVSGAGSFQGLDLDDGRPVMSQFGYNLDHGVIMECLAEHYRLSGDAAWLGRVAPNLVAAGDFVIRERGTTKVDNPDGQPVPEWGLLPAGCLEDNPEWRHWFAVNAHAHRGLAASAECLAEIGHPEAERLRREAAAYREDIRAAVRRAIIESPVVRLLDGAYVPHVPTHAGLRGREKGWFREAAYGPLHLLDGGVFEPWETEMTWVLKDLEDNLFVSREWGRPVDLERCWFSHGGVAIQANLMDLAIDYLRRGQVEHALRALFNNFGSQLYPHLRVFTEHPVVELGHGVGPFYKSSDEAKALLWLRACLIREEGARLILAPGARRAWLAAGQAFGVARMATAFGPLTYRYEAVADEVTVRVAVPERRPPAELMVHLRRLDRRPLRAVTANGRAHGEFDAGQETVCIARPAGDVVIRAYY